jgi:glycosyltransferase involved in cell wall biosynthesis
VKILFVTTYLHDLGGAEKAALGEAELLMQAGHEVRFLAFLHPDGRRPDYPVPANGLMDKAFVNSQGLATKIHLFGELLYNRAAAHQLRRALRLESPDIVHLHRVKPFSAALYFELARWAGPVVMTVHDHYLTCPSSSRVLGDGTPCPKAACEAGFAIQHRCVGNSRIQTAVAVTEFGYRRRWVGDLTAVDRFLMPSRFLLEWTRRAGVAAHQLSYLPNFTALRPPVLSPGEHVTYVGRLSPEKGLVTLLHSARRLPQLSFQVVGDGPQRSYLEKLAEELGLTNVMFTGSLSGHALDEAYRRSSLLVLPSECLENAPMTILESFSYGLPVVGSDRGGIPELIEDGQTGVLFVPGDAEHLASRILGLAQDPSAARRMGEIASQRVREMFSPQAHYRGLMDVYQSLVGS